MNYTAIAEDADTFVLKIKKMDLLLNLPADCIESMTNDTLKRSTQMRERIK